MSLEKATYFSVRLLFSSPPHRKSSIYLSLYCHMLLFIPNTARMTLPQDKEIMLLLCSKYSKGFPSHLEENPSPHGGGQVFAPDLVPQASPGCVSSDSSPGSLVLLHPRLFLSQISSRLWFLAFAILSSWGVSSRYWHGSFPYFLQVPFYKSS